MNQMSVIRWVLVVVGREAWDFVLIGRNHLQLRHEKARAYLSVDLLHTIYKHIFLFCDDKTWARIVEYHRRVGYSYASSPKGFLLTVVLLHNRCSFSRSFCGDGSTLLQL